VESNIVMEQPSNPELTRAVLDDLGLRVQLDHRLGVRGAGLSGGQAHRVSIARALFRARSLNCPVLLLDEPSAALDDGSEKQLIHALRCETAAGRAVLVISHHQAMREAADHLVELHTANAGVPG
jgi:ATP-binding cassette subfamily C protein CydD